MKGKTNAYALVEDEKRKQTATYLANIGAEAYESSKESSSDGLTDVLIRKLRPGVRRKLADRLIDIALAEGSGASDRTSLEAIREIYDRVEGRAKVSVTQSRAESDPLMRILSEVMAGESKLITAPPSPVIVEGLVRDITNE